MTSDERDQLLLLIRKCKEHQVQASLYRTLLRLKLEEMKTPAFHLKNEADMLRPSVQPAIEEEYRALETAILDGADPLPALKQFLELHS
jgi:hypothetical protein